ncbi:MAG: monovalent cation/H+ antiporter complex subunit F [Egibacteraceae bacterium]
MGIVTGLCLILLTGAAWLCLARMVRTCSLADRAVALDLLLLVTVLAIAVYEVRRNSTEFLDLLVVVSLLGFVGTATVARFIERRGA